MAPPIEAVLAPLPTSSATTSLQNAATSTAPIPQQPNDSFLEVSYSTDGQNWISLRDVSLGNLANLTVPVPVSSWGDLKNLQIRVAGIPTTQNPVPKIYLDGMLLEARYTIPPPLNPAGGGGAPASPTGQTSASTAGQPQSLPIITLPPSQAPQPSQNSFRADESPTFTIDLGNLPAPASSTEAAPQESPPTPAAATSTPASTSTSSFLRRPLALLGFFLRIFEEERAEALRIFGVGRAEAQNTTSTAAGLPTPDNPVVMQVWGMNAADNFTRADINPYAVVVNGRLSVSVPEPQSEFRPGKYELRLWILQNSAIYFTESDFRWGVLAANFNKSIYDLGDAAKIGFAVLTDQGHTVCDAKIDAQISSPSGKVFALSTADGTIQRNKTCGPQTVTNDPDYSAKIKVSETGAWQIKITAKDSYDPPREITDRFEAQNPPLFDVERIGPTRIYPPANYEMTIKIKANGDFSGQIAETLPASFDVIPETFAQRNFSGGAQTVSWQVNLTSGSSTELKYIFEAPNVSPELYKLGPLQIGSWREAREWQIAADAAGEIILLWDGTSTTVPVGWTCVSCAATDPFFGGVFPRASSTYGSASSSSNFDSHTASSSAQVDSGSADTYVNAAGTAFPASTHTHTVAQFKTAAADIRPPTINLIFIKAATTTIPNGAIGMFGVASTSLPSHWTWYQAMNNQYLAGDIATSSVGATTHQHLFDASSTAATSSLVVGSGGAPHTVANDAHTHDVASSTPPVTNAPPFIKIVFAKSNATSVLAAGSGSNGLIALFDNTSLPANWNIVSTSGSPYASSTGGFFLEGSDSWGATGGTITDAPTSTTVTSAGPNLTATTKNNTGTNYASSGHTHNFVVSFDATTSIPMYRDVILGKFTEPANAPPTVSGVTLNHGNAIVLTPNATTSFDINWNVSDPDGCTDINTNAATSTAFRFGVRSTCAVPSPTTNNLNCYLDATRVTSTCSGTTINVTDTVKIYYFADATDASSSFPTDAWEAFAWANDAANTTGSATSTNVVLNTLLAINPATSSVNYGSVTAGTNTGSTNQTIDIQNAGNSSSTLQVSGQNLVFGANSVPVGNQTYATSSFTYGVATGTALSSVDTTITGVLLTSPSSTKAVTSTIFWGIAVPNGNPTGSYQGTTTFTGVFSP